MFSLNPKFQEAHQRTLREHLIEYTKIILIWCPLFAVIFTAALSSWQHFFISSAISFVIAVTCATFCYWGSFFLEFFLGELFLRLKKTPLKQSLWRGVALSYIFLIPGLYFGYQLASELSVLAGHQPFSADLRSYRVGIFYGLFVSGAFLLFDILEKAKNAEREAKIKSQKLENEKLKAKVSALTAQMNPHLLFNSLNTIASTISTSPVTAEEMTLQLSELYRGVLAAAKGEMHSLEKELSICRSYLEIEKGRFGDRVDYEFIIAPQVDVEGLLVPVLMLQPLVENAVKHGLAPKREGGKVTVEVSLQEGRLVAKVTDNGAGSSSPQGTGTGTGLKNSESRISLKYGERGEFDFHRDEKGARVAIQIPLEFAHA